ncbi:MAG: DUF4238 domain-containing protein [Bacteroidales bacterium]|nr:DUF4238 domain-containing protein [Bacteroidales bacterium]
MKKNHHYIPVFYQKLFSNNGKSIGKYMISEDVFIKNSSIKKTGKIDYYYGKDEEIENTFMLLEGQASAIIKKIIETQSVPSYDSEDYDTLLLFLVTLEARVNKIGLSANAQLKSFTKVMLEMKRDHGQIDISDEDLEKHSLSYDVPTLVSIQAAVKVYSILKDLRCVLIVSDVNRYFITSDNPVVRYNYMYNQRNYTTRNYGLGNIGIQLFLPISPKLCLYVYDHIMYNTPLEADNNFHIKRARDIDKLNSLFYMNSYEFILFDSFVKEDYIRSLVRKKENLKNADDNFWVLGSKDEKIMSYQFAYVKKSIYIDIFKINRDLITMDLPLHMAGPMRPFAKQFMD